MLYINYTCNGEPFKDYEAELSAREAYELSKQGSYFVDFATENFYYAIRILVKRGVIPCTEVTVLCEGKPLGQIIKSNGRCSVWPSGFCDKTDNWLSELCS